LYQGSLAPVSRREDWIVSSPLIDETGDEITLTGATIKVFVALKVVQITRFYPAPRMTAR
jgi:hypothetical protein